MTYFNIPTAVKRRRGKEKQWFQYCSYNPHKTGVPNHFHKFDKK